MRFVWRVVRTAEQLLWESGDKKRFPQELSTVFVLWRLIFLQNKKKNEVAKPSCHIHYVSLHSRKGLVVGVL